MRITEFTKAPIIVKEFPETQGKIGEVITIYKINEPSLKVRDYFVVIRDIIQEEGVFLHYLEKLPELSHKEKLRRVRQDDY